MKLTERRTDVRPEPANDFLGVVDSTAVLIQLLDEIGLGGSGDFCLLVPHRLRDSSEASFSDSVSSRLSNCASLSVGDLRRIMNRYAGDQDIRSDSLI